MQGAPLWVRSVGGLASALDPVLRARQGLWLCAGDEERPHAPPRDVAGYDVATIPLSVSEVDGYYRRVSNGLLWPLFHSFPTRVRTQNAPWRAYRDVNRRFAWTAASAGGASTFWVHDFQLALVPRELRALRRDARIGWFNHIPFPAPEIFATMPERDDLLDGLLGADVLGFQTPRDVKNFLATVSELTPHTVDTANLTVHVGNRSIRVQAFPIGIDVDAVESMAAADSTQENLSQLRQRWVGLHVLLAVDRLDYTKGLPERFRAFAEMLKRHPDLLGKVVLVQIAVPSRTEVEQYAALKREVDELVGQINGRFARPGWTPIHYLYRSFSFEDLIALYQRADVAVVTPLRDGMNLVAHEFVAARADRDGVLVLSEHAGAASILEGAVRVNPYDLPRTADALAGALSMSLSERHARMALLQTCVRAHHVSQWQAHFLAALESWDRGAESAPGALRTATLVRSESTLDSERGESE